MMIKKGAWVTSEAAQRTQDFSHSFVSNMGKILRE